MVYLAEDVSSLASAFDLNLETEIQSIRCSHLEAKISKEQESGLLHYWDHLLYLTLLIVKVSWCLGDIILKINYYYLFSFLKPV